MKKGISVFDAEFDEVIESFVASGKTDYKFALKNLYPLIDRFEAQRKIQNSNLYSRLQKDILDGCLMPPITIAFVDREEKDLTTRAKFEGYVNSNIDHAYILDGMQRLNTLNSASMEDDYDDGRPIYVNMIVAKSQDKLLYRMITLNNGQRPMTPRHQIEILTKNMFDFDRLKVISVQTEKERGKKIIRGSFNVGDIAKGYLGFLTKNVNNENNKIIDEKMDEILVTRVLDSRVEGDTIVFEDVIALIDRLSAEPLVKKWFKVPNNLIGFCVGIHDSYNVMKDVDPTEFSDSLVLFDDVFDALNASKVNLGRYRRAFCKDYVSHYEKLSNYDYNNLLEHLVELTST